ncbi:MAG: response regulator transcription factor [Clostridia bacterium]
MSTKALILVVEDDATISGFISTVLMSNGYRVITAGTGEEALSLTASHVPDLILLDLGLPDMDGTAVLKQIRQWFKIPIVVVSARGHEREKVEALDLGADDYMVKPFGTGELLARMRTELRHSTSGMTNYAGNEPFSVGELTVDYEKRNVTLAGELLHLTPTEYKILVLLSKNAGKVLTHDYIIKDIWGLYANESHTLRVNMANLRRKIEKNPGEPQYIQTETGVGYRLTDEMR